MKDALEFIGQKLLNGEVLIVKIKDEKFRIKKVE